MGIKFEENIIVIVTVRRYYFSLDKLEEIFIYNKNRF